MKILVVSDSHRDNDRLMSVIKNEAPFDMFVHCGDVEGAEYMLSRILECPYEIVSGNNDFFSELPREREIEIEGVRLFVTHGHYYGVSMDYSVLADEGKARGADIVLFGHTHRPCIEKYGKVLLINPGSIAYPRQEGRKKSYAVVEISKKGSIYAEIKYF